jgi:FecR protein
MLRRSSFTRAVHTLLIAAALVVSTNPLRAQCVVSADSIGTGAMVLLQSGDVSHAGDRAGYRVIIPPCGVVKQQQVIKTGPDGYAKFQVSDGSTFEVFPNSEVTFRKSYGIGDLLNVWMGKVKVYIQHFPGVPNPNNVTTPTALISVRGTIFDVDVQADGTTFVTLDEGLVDVRHLLVASRIIRLNPGESVQVLPNVPLAALPRDKGMIFRQVLRGLEDAVRQAIYQRPSGPGNAGAGAGTGPISSGPQGSGQGKNTGTTTGTGNTGNGTPTGAPTGAPPAPPPPPPPGGGGD